MMAKHAEVTARLNESIADEKDGLIAAIDDLVDELREHKEEMGLLRAAIGNTKINVDVLAALERITGHRRCSS